MDSLSYNFPSEEIRSGFTTATDLTTPTVTASNAPSMPATPSEAYAPLPLNPNFHGHSANELLNLLGPQEPRAGDTAPSTLELDDMMMNFRINGSEINFDDNSNYFSGPSGRESVSSNLWNEGPASAPSTPAPRPNDQMVTFDFLVKSVSAANNYVSMLTREQLSVLQSLRPSLLYEFLQEVAKVRSDKRSRRALPNECAFCKNNGENEECYSSHALKDWRGRVQCPVLRAFRCPRCGATGDRAHTIKYCPESSDNVSERLSSRRRMPPSSLLMDQHSMHSSLNSMPPTPGSGPPPSPAGGLPNNIWSFGMN